MCGVGGEGNVNEGRTYDLRRGGRGELHSLLTQPMGGVFANPLSRPQAERSTVMIQTAPKPNAVTRGFIIANFDFTKKYKIETRIPISHHSHISSLVMSTSQ